MEAQEIMGGHEQNGDDNGHEGCFDSGYESGRSATNHEGADQSLGEDRTITTSQEGGPPQPTENSNSTDSRGPVEMANQDESLQEQPGPSNNCPGRKADIANKGLKRSNHHASNKKQSQLLRHIVDQQSRSPDGNLTNEYTDAYNATLQYLVEDTQGRPVDECGTGRIADSARERMARAIDDAGKSSLDCHQCKKLPDADRIEQYRHNITKVRSAVVIKDPLERQSEPRILDTFQFPNVLADNSNLQKDIKDYGKQCYWNDPTFFSEMAETAQHRLHKVFPFQQFRRTNITYHLEPAAISYMTSKKIQHTAPIGHYTGTGKKARNQKKPVPRHIIAKPDDKGMKRHADFDSCYTITFLCKVDTKTATDIQITAHDDELSKRLKLITNDGQQTSLATMAKVMLTYAEYQAKRHLQNPPNPYPTVTPIEYTLDPDLRKRLKKVEKLIKLQESLNRMNQIYSVEKMATEKAEQMNKANPPTPFPRRFHSLTNGFTPNISISRIPDEKATTPTPFPRRFQTLRNEFSPNISISRIQEEGTTTPTPWTTTLADRVRRTRARTVHQYLSQEDQPMNNGPPQVPTSSANAVVRRFHQDGYKKGYWRPWTNEPTGLRRHSRTHTATSRPEERNLQINTSQPPPGFSFPHSRLRHRLQEEPQNGPFPNNNRPRRHRSHSPNREHKKSRHQG